MPIPIAEKEYHIQPNDIDTNHHFWEAFGHMETEISARYIVRFCQEKGGWHPFSKKEIDEFYQRVRAQSKGYTVQESFCFNALVEPITEHLFAGRTTTIGGGWIIKGQDDKYYVTEDFINRCFGSSPVKKEKE